MEKGNHSAEASALGFYFQTFYALLTLLAQDTDQAAVAVERLDDVELKADGGTLLMQLKHSMSAAPQPITVKSRALWRTIDVWIDALPLLTLSETTFHLVAVGEIPSGDPLLALRSMEADRSDLHQAMVDEAKRVLDERARTKSGAVLPHAHRMAGCIAFLGLPEMARLNLLRRMMIKEHGPTIDQIEGLVAKQLKILPAEQRATVAERLIMWWDREVVYSLCGKRSRAIARAELQEAISTIIGDIERGRILPDFETVSPPEDYQPDGMLARQVRLVNGSVSDLGKAIREEWKAREQRAKWVTDKLSMASVVADYDTVLKEHWSDRHSRMAEDCAHGSDDQKRASGREVLRWTHDAAPTVVRPVVEGWNAAYYVRGSYQVLAINREVGWHPDFVTLLKDKE